MNITEFVKHRKHIVTGWKDVSGGAFFRAFDTAFGLPPVTEFPYLLRYIERLSVNADEVRATPPEPIARAVTILRHHLFHFGSPRNYKAATGTTVFPNTLTPNSPVAAHTNYLLQRHAVSTWEQDGHGDRSNGERAFPIVYSPILSFAGFSPFAVISSYVFALAPPAKAASRRPETQAKEPGSTPGGAASNHKAERQAGDNRAASISSRSVPSYFTQGETLHFLSSCAKVPAGTLLDANPRKAETTEPNTMNGKTMQRNAEVGGIPPSWSSSAGGAEKLKFRQSESIDAFRPVKRVGTGTPDNFFLVCLRSDDVESLATLGFNSPGTPFDLRDYDGLRSSLSTC